MYIDSHAHLNFREYKDEIPEVIRRAQKAGVGAIVNVGSNYSTSQNAIRIAQQYNANLRMIRQAHHKLYANATNKLTTNSQKLKAKIYANVKNKDRTFQHSAECWNVCKIYTAVGVHPIHLVKDIVEKTVFDGREYSFRTKKEDFDYGKFKKLAKSSDKVVAIGETGIDLYHVTYNPSSRAKLATGQSMKHVTKGKNNDQFPISNFQLNSKSQITNFKRIQIEAFKQHIKLAKKLNLPLIIHGRGTKEDPYRVYDLILKILKSSKPTSTRGVEVKGVAHCFAGSLKQAKEFVKLGFYIGFTGIVTFKNATEIQQIAREIPLEKILIETDCPFLAPVPYRGKRNEPAYVVEVACKIAELKNITIEKVGEQTTENAKKLFGI